jgi:hypothetical protein
VDARPWKECFTNWPEHLERRGIIVTSLGEQIPFDDFATSESMLLIERRTPDASGARKVIIPYDGLATLKIVDVAAIKDFAGLGFVEKIGKKTKHRGE